MTHTIIVDKKSYDLPKRTLSVIERMENVIKLDKDPELSLRQKYQAIYDTIADILGPQNVKEVLGTDDLDDIDISEMLITFRKIVDAYNKPVSDYAQKVGMEALNQIPMNKLTQIAKIAEEAKAVKDLAQ